MNRRMGDNRITTFSKKSIIGVFIAAIVLIVAILIAAILVLGVFLKNWDHVFTLIPSTVLIVVTMFYVYYTMKIADAARQQADAGVKMAEMASRPVIIQKAVVETETRFATFGSKDWFSYFEVYNAGNGPAIELEVSLLDKDKNQFASHRTTFLRAGDSPIHWPDPFDNELSVNLAGLDESSYYFVSEYQGTLSAGPPAKWYQTWLPFETIETSQKGKIFVKPGQLEFKEVTEKERIDAFGSRSKPK